MSDKLKPFRALINWLLGDDDHSIPPLPQGLPEELAGTLERHVRMLVEFQNTDYAMLYLDRLGRFHERSGVSPELFREIVDLLARRMCFNDPIRVAQIVLGRAELAETTINPPNNLYRPEVEEAVAMLPRDLAQTLAEMLMMVKMLRGRMRLRIDRATGRMWLRLFLLGRRIRPTTLRYYKESSSTERWLHMIDRALSKQPAAVTEVVRSLEVVGGYGASLRLSVANWNLIINRLAKPVFDGELMLPQLPAALARARSAAAADPTGEELRRTIAEVRAAAEAAGAHDAAGSP